MDEFSLIRTYLAPLARRMTGSLKLADDAALLSPPPGKELVVTADALCAGVHFLGSEEPGQLAQKLLRVNLSDLAAMGATPYAYFLTLMLPKTTSSKWFREFTSGLREDQQAFGIQLAGGDTTSTRGSVSLSMTAIGTVAKGKALKRSGAKVGDVVYVSGTLGDAALGLQILQTKVLFPREQESAFLQRRYQLPEPRLKLGASLAGLATSCMDVSDGLLQDAGHIARASGVAVEIERHLLPLSKAAGHFSDAYEYAQSGGDDYELLFTVPARFQAKVAALAAKLGLPLTRIGTIKKGKGVALLDENGQKLFVSRRGYKHFH
jgi:thiamine-monophosphate kinase